MENNNQNPTQDNDLTFTAEETQEKIEKALAKNTAKWKSRVEKLEARIEELVAELESNKGKNKDDKKPQDTEGNDEIKVLSEKFDKLLKLYEEQAEKLKKAEQKAVFDEAVKVVEQEIGKKLPSFVLRNISIEGTQEEIINNIKETYQEYVSELKANGFFSTEDVQTKPVSISSQIGTDAGTDYKAKIKEARAKGNIVLAKQLELEAKEKNLL